MALVKPAERSSTAVHRWRECLNGNSAGIPKGIFKMTFLVRAAACQRPSIRNDVAAVDSDAADFDPSGFLTAPLIANQSAIFQNGQRLVGSRANKIKLLMAISGVPVCRRVAKAHVRVHIRNKALACP